MSTEAARAGFASASAALAARLKPPMRRMLAAEGVGDRRTFEALRALGLAWTTKNGARDLTPMGKAVGRIVRNGMDTG